MFASSLDTTGSSRFSGTLYLTSIGSFDNVMDGNEILDWLLAWEVDVACFSTSTFFTNTSSAARTARNITKIL